jgi:addiction module HigA family antidote
MAKTTPTPSSTLLSYLDQYQISPLALSKAIGMSYSGVRQLITGKSKISVPSALKLGKYFGQTSIFWLDLQREADLSEAAKDKELQSVLKAIVKVKKPSAAAKAKASTKKDENGRSNSKGKKGKENTSADKARKPRRIKKEDEKTIEVDTSL